MTDPIVYNIPVAMVDAYRGRTLVVRSGDPAEIIAAISVKDAENLAYVQVLGLGAAIDSLARWECRVPLDLVVERPEADLPLLYRYSPLLADHPIRVSVPMLHGFAKVARLAVSLDFAVKIEGAQPAPDLTRELLHAADDYLHRAAVAVPIEFMHSLFLAFYRQDAVTLWDIQEENPGRLRYVTDQGEETVSKRFAGMDLPCDLDDFPARYLAGLIAEKRECSDCEYLHHCAGYFKWPQADYRCDGVKTLFRNMLQAISYG